MTIQRKPSQAEWHDESATLIDEIQVKLDPWTESQSVEFYGTKRKDANRRTTFRVLFSEADVENLYVKLIQGRKKRLKAVLKGNRKSQNQINMIRASLYKLDANDTSASELRDQVNEIIGLVNLVEIDLGDPA